MSEGNYWSSGMFDPIAAREPACTEAGCPSRYSTIYIMPNMLRIIRKNIVSKRGN